VKQADRAQVAVAAPDFQPVLKIYIATANHDVGDVAGADPKQVRRVGQFDRDDLVAEALVIHVVVLAEFLALALVNRLDRYSGFLQQSDSPPSESPP